MSCSSWGEVGWQLPRATTREELRAALDPLKDHADRHRINRLLLASTFSAKGEEIREARDANGKPIAQIYAAQDRQRLCADSITQAEMALGQASPDQVKTLKAEISKRKADLDAANEEHRIACDKQEQFQKRIDQMEAGYAQDELLMFIDKRFINGKYARDPDIHELIKKCFQGAKAKFHGYFERAGVDEMIQVFYTVGFIGYEQTASGSDVYRQPNTLHSS
jgi:chromosome segregation ATPase